MQYDIARASVALFCVFVTGCAAGRIAGPATTIDNEVKSVLAELTDFQTDAAAYRRDSLDGIDMYNAQKGANEAHLAQLQAQWTLAGDSRAPLALSALRSATTGSAPSVVTTTAAGSTPANAAVSASGAGAVASASTNVPAAASDPVQSLAGVVTMLDQLSKAPDTDADLNSGIGFLKTAGQDLQAARANAASAPAAGSSASATGKPK